MKKILLIIAGWFFVGLAVLGIFLPLLPATPFLLLAAACFYRSSKKFHTWLITNRYLGKYITNYRNKKGIPLKPKIYTLILLNGSIFYSIYIFRNSVYIGILLGLVAIGVSLYLLLMKTIIETE